MFIFLQSISLVSSACLGIVVIMFADYLAALTV
jgi:hypothetical protein